MIFMLPLDTILKTGKSAQVSIFQREMWVKGDSGSTTITAAGWVLIAPVDTS